jgi:CRISPR type IV-associated protein Csf3
MIVLPVFDAYTKRYAGLTTRPLRITCTLRNTRIASFDPIMFDGVLAAAIVREATEGRGLARTANDLYDIPLPLLCAWRDPATGYPLWEASCLLPAGDTAEDRTHFHKRRQTGRYTTVKRGVFTIDPARGRWMERRYVVRQTVTPHLVAECIGNAEEIARLLATITHVGKYRGAGMGEVESWTIDEVESVSFVRDGRLTRPYPAAYFGAMGDVVNARPVEPSTLIAWTPPYWHGACLADGWRAGTLVEQEVAI